MTTADQKVERAANKLQQLANQMAGEGGVKAKLAEPLAADADFCLLYTSPSPRD